MNVYEIITKPVITKPIDKDGRYVARLLCRAGIIRGPVEENRKIVGILEIASLILENELF